MTIVHSEDRLNHQVASVLTMLTPAEIGAVADELGWLPQQLMAPLIAEILEGERSVAMPLSNLISDAIEGATDYQWYDGLVATSPSSWDA